MFDLRVPESLAALPSRVHVCFDDDLSREEQELAVRLRSQDREAQERYSKLNNALTRSVFRDIKQCRFCGEVMWNKMLHHHGGPTNLCKACHSKQVVARRKRATS